MKREFQAGICFIMIMVLCAALSAENIDGVENPGRQFADFSMNFSPGLDGTINAQLDLNLNWLDWLSSGISLYTDNYVLTRNTDTDVSTIVSTGRTAMLTLLRIDEELVWRMTDFRLGFLTFSLGIIGAYDWTEQKQYGYDPSENPPGFYIDESTISVLRPLQSYTLGMIYGPVRLRGYFRSTLYWADERVTILLYTSDMDVEDLPGPETKVYDGGDTIVGCSIELDLPFVRLLGSYEYYRHIMTDQTAAGTSQTETHTAGGGVVLSFIRLAGGSPRVGASFLRKRDFLVSTREIIVTDMVRLDFGLQY